MKASTSTPPVHTSTSTPPVHIYVDVDATLVGRADSSPITSFIQHIRELHAQSAILCCWSAGGAEHARRSAEAFGLAECFSAFLAKPDVVIDQRAAEWPRSVLVHPAACGGRSVDDYRDQLCSVPEENHGETGAWDAQQQIATTLESVTDGFMRYDRDWRIVYANAEAERINKLSRAEMLGKTPWELFPAVLGTKLELEFRRAVAEQVTVEFENHYEPFGRWYSLKGYPTPDGGLTTFIRDITQQKLIEQQLVQSETRYRAIGESINFGVWECDAAGRNVYVSESFLKLVGITQQQCSDFGWGALLHPDDAEATIAAWKTCVQTQGTWDRIHRFKGVDGQWHHVLARGVPLRDATGRVLGWAGINLDISRRIEAEQGLARIAEEAQRQRRLYETVLTNTPDLAYVFDLQHRFTYANHALLALWGKSSEEAIGKNCLELGYEPWHAAMHDREIDQVVATKQPIRGEVAFTGTNGARFYDYIFVPVFGADGEVEAVAGTTRDVTERKDTEERLRASDERQAFLVRLGDTLRPLSDPVEVQAEASRVLGEHLGANRAVYFEVQGDGYVVERDYANAAPSVVGRHPIAAFGPDQLALYRAGLTACEADVLLLQSRTPDEKEAFAKVQIRSYVGVPLVKGGVFVAGLAVHSASVRTWTPNEIAIIEETAERTWAAVERVRAEAALRQSEERSAFVRRSSGVGFWYCDLPFDVLQWDDLVKAHFHLPPDAAVTIETFYDRLHPDDREATRQAIERSIAGQTPYNVDYRTVDPVTGAANWVRAIGRTFYAADGTPTRFDGVTLDVTEQRQAEASLRESEGQLRDADRRKDEFLATLAHELRNPLAPIRNGLQVMKVVGVDGVIEQARSMMERQLTQLIRLVDDLLDVSRVTSGKLDLRRERIELASVIESAVETSRPLFEQAGHALAVVMPEEPVFLDGDPTRLSQIVSNLLNNSAKYTPRGGNVELTVSREHSVAVVLVKDDGIGIPPAMLGKVFEMFTQVDRALEKTTGGLGIGLSLVKGLVEMHGGSIEARSEGQGQGSQFIVRLPIDVESRAD